MPYRSLNLQLRNIKDGPYQTHAVVNHPNAEDFTRITEYRHFMADPPKGSASTIHKEYPAEYIQGYNDPYYIIPGEESSAIADR